MLKLSKATVVDAAAVKTPVLVIGGECDRIVPAEVLRQTAAQYQHAEIVQMPGSDHMVFSGASLSITVGHIDDWLIKNQLTSVAPN
jgi:pimeloyl-ACP methyl ester carboxylesterase